MNPRSETNKIKKSYHRPHVLDYGDILKKTQKIISPRSDTGQTGKT
jgi:hypothetical protein